MIRYSTSGLMCKYCMTGLSGNPDAQRSTRSQRTIWQVGLWLSFSVIDYCYYQHRRMSRRSCCCRGCCCCYCGVVIIFKNCQVIRFEVVHCPECEEKVNWFQIQPLLGHNSWSILDSMTIKYEFEKRELPIDGLLAKLFTCLCLIINE